MASVRKTTSMAFIKTMLSSVPLLFATALNAADEQQLSNASTRITAPARAPDKLHKFSGTWTFEGVPTRIPSAGEIPYKPEYEAQRAEIARRFAADEPAEGNEPRCIPNGPIMTMKFTPQIFVDATRMTINARSMLRFIDIGKPHTSSNALFDTYAGDSVAHWEGDVLVVDTIGLMRSNEISWGIANSGHLHLVERFKLRRDDKLEIETMVEDPEVLTKPWRYTNVYSRRAPLTNLEIYYCIVATDRISISAGEQKLDLTPPAGGYIPPGADR